MLQGSILIATIIFIFFNYFYRKLIANLKNEISSMIKQHQIQLSMLEDDLDRSKKEKAAYCENLLNIQKEFDEKYTKLTSEYIQTEKEKATLFESILRLESELSELIVQQDIKIKELTSDLYQVEQEKAGLLESFSLLDNEIKFLKNKYYPIEHRVTDIKQYEQEIQKLFIQRSYLIDKKSDLEDSYLTGRKKYDELCKEITSLDDTLEIYSNGLYNPHFNYDTSKNYKDAINECYEECKKLIQNDTAVSCETQWTINGSKTEGKRQTKHYSKMMLRAFNGECDAAIAKTRWNNIVSMEERIEKSFIAINKLGETHQMFLKSEYRDIRLKELRLTFEYQEKIQDEREEQRRIREQMREEERSIKELENAKIEAEKEENRYLKALIKAKSDLNTKHGEEKIILEDKIRELEIHLVQATELKERAVSMAQITKSGHVYVISNIGSFGENIFKIGMTRRLEPTDRIRELGGASVPFGFDVHAMIYSTNAPELENNFHKKLAHKRVNWVNGRKEFFNAELSEIEAFTIELNHEIEFIKVVEARDYRETKARIQKYKEVGEFVNTTKNYPEFLFSDDYELDDGFCEVFSQEPNII